MHKDILKSLAGHWAGKASLTWLLLVNLLAVRLLVYVIGNKLSGLPEAVWYVLFTFMAVILIWQIIGSIRAARSGLDHPDGIYAIIAIFAALVAVLISTSWQVTDQYHRLYDAPPEPYVDPSIIRLPRSDDGSQIIFAGPITLKQYNAFRDLQDYENLHQVVLNSEGGNIFAARGLYRLIRERGLNTHVDGECYSACTLVFIAGEKRTAAGNAIFGFHSYAYAHDHTGKAVDVIAEQTKDIVLFQNQGVPVSFITRIFETPASSLWNPTHAELLDANILN